MSTDLWWQSMMRKWTCLALVAIWAAILPNAAPAQSQGARHVAVSLVAETRSIVPGQPFHLGLRRLLKPLAGNQQEAFNGKTFQS
jgi:hypothetical protein